MIIPKYNDQQIVGHVRGVHTRAAGIYEDLNRTREIHKAGMDKFVEDNQYLVEDHGWTNVQVASYFPGWSEREESIWKALRTVIDSLNPHQHEKMRIDIGRTEG